MRVVLDTNVLVSALLFGGKPSRIVELAKDGLIELVVSPLPWMRAEGSPAVGQRNSCPSILAMKCDRRDAVNILKYVLK